MTGLGDGYNIDTTRATEGPSDLILLDESVSLRFRKSFRLFPGARLNLSKTGVSLSLGAPGATLNLSHRGVRTTAGIPGSGLSYSASISDTEGLSGRGAAAPDAEYRDDVPAVWAPGSWQGSVVRYKSGPTATLTSASLADLRELMCSAKTQKEEAQSRLTDTEAKIAGLRGEQKSKSFFLWSWAFKGRLAALPDLITEAEDEAEELRQWVSGSGVPVNTTFDENVARAVVALVSAMEKATKCSAIWDITTKQGVDRRERSAATTAVERERISVSRRHTPWVNDADHPGCLFGNANGDPLIFYPGFLLVDGGEKNGPALVSYQDLSVTYDISPFLEEGSIPDDAVVVDKTWAKVNKNGSPDRRFKDNYQIPVVAYGTLELRTQAGLHEVYQFSHAGIGMAVATSLVWLRLAMMSTSKFEEMSDDVNASGGDTAKMLAILQRYGGIR